MAQPTPPGRRGFRFRLRTLLIAIAVVSTPLAWVAKERRQSAHEMQVADELRSQGVPDITIGGPYDWNRRGREGAWRHLARRVLGERILSMSSSGEELYVDHLRSLARLNSLRMIWLLHAPISDLTPIAHLTKLEYLNIYGSKVSDLAPLADLTNLKTLDVCGTKVSNLTPLFRLAKLESLNVRMTRVTREQVEALQRALPNCQIAHDPFP